MSNHPVLDIADQQESPSVAKPNPSVDAEDLERIRRLRRPMSVPQQKLQVSERPGYHRHWFREINVPRALAAAYQFVDQQDIQINQLGLAEMDGSQASADLGTRVKVLGGVNDLSHPEYLVLMELRQEFWDEDRAKLDAANAKRMGGIFRDEQILDSPDHPVRSDDQELRYVSKALFNRPTRKSKKLRAS